jgi:hypothetical protein
MIARRVGSAMPWRVLENVSLHIDGPKYATIQLHMSNATEWFRKLFSEDQEFIGSVRDGSLVSCCASPINIPSGPRM